MKRNLITPVCRAQLCKLIQSQGLQTNLFNRSLLILQWKGLEYQLLKKGNSLCLHQIIVQMDVQVGHFNFLTRDTIR
jgi:hypothetical protein